MARTSSDAPAVPSAAPSSASSKRDGEIQSASPTIGERLVMQQLRQACAPGSRCPATGRRRRHRTVEKGVRCRSTSVTSEPISTILPRNQLSGMKPATAAEYLPERLGHRDRCRWARGRPCQTIGTCSARGLHADAGRQGPRQARQYNDHPTLRRERHSAPCRTGRWAGWPGRAAAAAPWRPRTLSAPASPRSANRRHS